MSARASTRNLLPMVALALAGLSGPGAALAQPLAPPPVAPPPIDQPPTQAPPQQPPPAQPAPQQPPAQPPPPAPQPLPPPAQPYPQQPAPAPGPPAAAGPGLPPSYPPPGPGTPPAGFPPAPLPPPAAGQPYAPPTAPAAPIPGHAVPANPAPPAWPPPPRTPPAPAVQAEVDASAEDRWHRPSSNDQKLPWNRYNAWGSWERYDAQTRAAFWLTLSTATHSFRSKLDGNGGELSLRVGVGNFGIVLGKYMPHSRNILGIDLLSHSGVVLYDARLPDIQVGLVLPSLQARWISGDDVNIGNALLSIIGARVVVEDFVRVDVRPIAGIWVGKENVAWSLGGTVDAGIVF